MAINSLAVFHEDLIGFQGKLEFIKWHPRDRGKVYVYIHEVIFSPGKLCVYVGLSLVSSATVVRVTN